MFYVFWNIGSIITGAIFYEEMKAFTTLQWVAFILGAFVLFLGVVLISLAARRRAQKVQLPTSPHLTPPPLPYLALPHVPHRT